MFRQESTPNFPQLEARVLEFWRQRGIYEKSLARRAGAPRFVFYEGPPTANGMPHPGHCLTRAIKDLFPRYRTMRGYLCERKAGWDTHGLPVEVEVCKELGIHSKEEIETYGVEPFIHRCQESVWRYMREWERITQRLGFWIHLDEAYVTYHQSYVESVWWALKDLFDRGLLYQGYKIVWWWAQGGTALSSGEVGQGYREVADPSVYVRFPLIDSDGRPADTDLLVWTTTPWTLPSNQFAAVHPDLDYVTVAVEGEPRTLIVAAALAETIAGKVKKKFTVERTIPGRDMIGWRFVPPFDYYYRSMGDVASALKSGDDEYLMWRVVAAEFVTVGSGTGVVHQAPAFGEVDFEVLKAEQARFRSGEGPQLLNAVSPDGRFTADAPDYQGRWVKDCDRDIVRDLRHRGLLFHQEQYLHEYPFCWRAEEDPLIQYPRRSWFIRTTAFKEAMLANNARMNWLPEHIREGRFGNFLETNVDWALSRERYWGTPLPIWQCEGCGQTQEAVASYAELLARPGVQGTDVWAEAKRKNPKLPDDLRVHKPYIDAVTYDSPCCPGQRMRRVSEVIDCWFDSGAMPFAQWGYPHRSREKFLQQFPADFISEALDQTRGWFYSLTAISTLLFGPRDGEAPAEPEAKPHPEAKPQAISTAAPHDADDSPATPRAACGFTTLNPQPSTLRPSTPFPHPFRNCIVLGLMLGEDGGKMSKSKRNYREPNEIFDRYGADALRWYFFANQAPWTSIRYSEQAIRDSIPEFLLRLWNVYSFFVIYANIDGFDPAARIDGDAGPLDAAALVRGRGCRPPRQRAELDRWVLAELNRTAAEVVERMDAYDNFAAAGRITAFVDALSNWYVRRSRDRFWSGEQSADKLDAHWTLYECLLTAAKLVAPFVPFVAEAMWQNLATEPFGSRALESVHLCDYPTGDPAAADALLGTRMGLVREIVSLGRAARSQANLKVRQPLAKVELILTDRAHQEWLAEHAALIADELNVKQVEFTAEADKYVSYTVLPDLKRLGPRLGKRLPAFREKLRQADPAALLRQLEATGETTIALDDGPATLWRDDVQVRLQARQGWTAAQGAVGVVVLSTALTPHLVAEGLAREVVHAIQTRRKDLDLAYTDRIEVGVETADADLRAAVERFAQYIQGETLAVRLVFEALPAGEPLECHIAGATLRLYVKRVDATQFNIAPEGRKSIARGETPGTGRQQIPFAPEGRE